MQRMPVTSGGISAEQTAVAVSTTAQQAVDSVHASRTSKWGVGSLLDSSSHMAAIPPFVFILLMGGVLFWLIYKSHLSFSANIGRRG